MIQFDDSETRWERWKVDKFAPFRKFFVEVNRRFLTLRKPSVHLAIDETLIRIGVGFKQYNPSKPAKHGLLFRSICDSTYFSLPYAGKPEGLPDEYYVTSTDNYTKYLVMHTTKVGGTACLRGRNIALDQYFTSLSVAEWCLEKTITLRSDCKGIPKEMKTDSGRESKSTKWCYNDEKMLILYADKKKNGTKIVLALTTMYDEMRVSKDKHKRLSPWSTMTIWRAVSTSSIWYPSVPLPRQRPNGGLWMQTGSSATLSRRMRKRYTMKSMKRIWLTLNLRGISGRSWLHPSSSNGVKTLLAYKLVFFPGWNEFLVQMTGLQKQYHPRQPAERKGILQTMFGWNCRSPLHNKEEEAQQQVAV